jgi:hypothetical protein
MRARAPAQLTKRLSPEQTTDVDRWWQELAPAERWALRPNAGRPPARVVVRFVVAGEAELEEGDASTSDFYEYLVNHEVILDDGRCYHICSAHPEARAALAAGRIPAEFRCPFARPTCPMRSLLDEAPGCDVRFSIARPEADSPPDLPPGCPQ